MIPFIENSRACKPIHGSRKQVGVAGGRGGERHGLDCKGNEGLFFSSSVLMESHVYVCVETYHTVHVTYMLCLTSQFYPNGTQ